MIRVGAGILELVIALIVIGVAIFSVENILLSSYRGDDLISERDIATKSLVLSNDILSRCWDSKIYEASKKNEFGGICDTHSQNHMFDRVGRLRIGDFNTTLQSPMFYSATTQASIQVQRVLDLHNLTTIDSLDDYHGVYTVVNGVRYDISIGYADDTVSINGNRAKVFWDLGVNFKNDTTNLKKITIKASVGDRIVGVFTAFSSNNGIAEDLYR